MESSVCPVRPPASSLLSLTFSHDTHPFLHSSSSFRLSNPIQARHGGRRHSIVQHKTPKRVQNLIAFAKPLFKRVDTSIEESQSAMSDAAPQPKTTPGRHRQRRNGRTAAQKAYASENDVGSFDSGHHHRTPHTPNKALSGSPAPGSQSSAQINSKQRNKSRGAKGKGAPVSPDAQPERGTPTGRRASMKSGIPAAAFAGATFHASPAPSALPIPSFLSKASSESPASNTRHPNDPRYSPPTTDNEAPASYSTSAPRAKESPLDFMFRAHRQEQERHFGSPRRDGQGSPSIFGRPESSPQVNVPQTAPPSIRYQSGGIDRSELDGTPSHEIGPAFSTPYHERIRAARASRGDAPPTAPQNTAAANSSSTDDATVALKKFLFGGGQQAAKSPLSSASSVQPPTPAYHQPAGQANDAGYGRGNNIQAMENDLRRILKLDSSS